MTPEARRSGSRGARLLRAATVSATGLAAYLAAVAVLLGLLLTGRWYGLHDYSDAQLYFDFARAIARGLRPYVDFPVEYPPLALPLFTLPGHTGDLFDYTIAFNLQMLALCGLTAVTVAVGAAGIWPAGRRPYAAALAFGACVLALGAIVANRYDAAVALVLGAAVVLASLGRHAGAAVALGLGFALKLTPALLLPLVLVLAGDRRRAAWCLAAFTVAAVLPFVPHLAAPGLWDVFTYHLARPVQLESLLTTPWLAAHALGLARVEVATAFGSQYVVAPGTAALASASGPLLLAAIAGVYALVWRARAALRASPEDVPLAALALVLALLACGKVLSPQFLVWLLPLAALVLPRRPLLGALVIATLAATQVEFPPMYMALSRLEGAGILALLVRNALLVAALALAVVALRRLGEARTA